MAPRPPASSSSERAGPAAGFLPPDLSFVSSLSHMPITTADRGIEAHLLDVIQSLRQGVDLIIMGAGREADEFVVELGKPSCVFRKMDAARFDHRRAKLQATGLVACRRDRNCIDAALRPQLLDERQSSGGGFDQSGRSPVLIVNSIRLA